MSVSGAASRITLTSCVPDPSPVREAGAQKANAGVSSSTMCTTASRRPITTPPSDVDSPIPTDSPNSPCTVSCTAPIHSCAFVPFAGTVTERVPKPPTTSASEAPPAPESVKSSVKALDFGLSIHAVIVTPPPSRKRYADSLSQIPVYSVITATAS